MEKIIFTNRTYDNSGFKMGDDNGPAFCVYGNTGYHKASMDVLLSQVQVQSFRKADQNNVSNFLFLGCDVFSSGSWCNCFDVGLAYNGKNPYWHLFFNLFEGGTEDQPRWYDSQIKINPKHDYRIVLDTSLKEGFATGFLYDLSDHCLADSITLSVKHLQTDGVNTAFLMNFAIDFPDPTCRDTQGVPSKDWEEVTLYNTDEDLYLRNIFVQNVRIWKHGTEKIWDAEATHHHALWPDKKFRKIDYDCTKVTYPEDGFDHTYQVDLDMNHRN